MLQKEAEDKGHSAQECGQEWRQARGNEDDESQLTGKTWRLIIALDKELKHFIS